MKLLGYIGIFLVSAVSMFMGLSRRQGNSDANSFPTIASTTSDEMNWDQKNRHRIKSAFFVDVPDWVRGSGDEATSGNAAAPSEPVSSGVQSNPFTK